MIFLTPDGVLPERGSKSLNSEILEYGGIQG